MVPLPLVRAKWLLNAEGDICWRWSSRLSTTQFKSSKTPMSELMLLRERYKSCWLSCTKHLD